jgi:hypothetical protein
MSKKNGKEQSSLPTLHIRFLAAARAFCFTVIFPFFKTKPMKYCCKHPFPKIHLKHFTTIRTTKMSHKNLQNKKLG